MPRRLATLVPQTASQLSRAGLIPRPAWLTPVTQHPPAPSLVKEPVLRSNDDLPLSLQRAYAGVQRKGALMAQSTSAGADRPARQLDGMNQRRRARRSELRMPKIRPMPIAYPIQDKIRSQFYIDHPFESWRAQSFVESEVVNEEDEAWTQKGLAWSKLAQKTRNPRAEDAIRFAAHLHESHRLPLARAYSEACAQYAALRAARATAIQFARREALAYTPARSNELVLGSNTPRGTLNADRFLPGYIDRGIQSEGKTFEAWNDPDLFGGAASRSGDEYLGRTLTHPRPMVEGGKFAGVKGYMDDLTNVKENVIEDLKAELTEESDSKTDGSKRTVKSYLDILTSLSSSRSSKPPAPAKPLTK
ncbi:uncharacterized protein L969DRAFT_96523 [Mixia osmundae IAM 14324]|uniref:Small ribosomal subunit protein mS23 n=1 Tax=Mixia osmundae (strain CBS 9802 / IAM 14324 / JCM 22182 / KY 12970) TaxID=764103 RepID=G7DUS8_MIXOS|nr:uncharacterized protein L969DRAFT_96523 [Mixia osmundae IAM 14324]KEI37444.1 hypothetical protein L969DRAFT_96523 [Mixia osmundae IAM 14324]GAA94338.1 hypothetical protein E5Q_00989 [Mixia osmundae IAM 14324]